MSKCKLSSVGSITLVSILTGASAFCLEYYVLSSKSVNSSSSPSHTLLPSVLSSEQAGLVFDEPEAELGSVRNKISHRFTYRNASTVPVTIINVGPSCSCAVSEPDRTTLQPEETGGITLEADLSHKEPGAHRFLLFVEYELAKRKATAIASLRVVHQPDLYVTPRYLKLTVTEGTGATAEVTLIDYRKEPLKILKIRSTSSAIEAKIRESPREYLPGWRYIIEMAYTDPSKETRREFQERVQIETSDAELPILTIPVDVHRLERLRIAPQVVTLHPDHPAEVIVRDSLGQKIAIADCDTTGLVETSFTKKEESVKKISLSLPGGSVDASKYPATIWIRVSRPCERRLPIRVSLAAPEGF